jgi:hypothetical protein
MRSGATNEVNSLRHTTGSGSAEPSTFNPISNAERASADSAAFNTKARVYYSAIIRNLSKKPETLKQATVAGTKDDETSFNTIVEFIPLPTNGLSFQLPRSKSNLALGFPVNLTPLYAPLNPKSSIYDLIVAPGAMGSISCVFDICPTGHKHEYANHKFNLVKAVKSQLSKGKQQQREMAAQKMLHKSTRKPVSHHSHYLICRHNN